MARRNLLAGPDPDAAASTNPLVVSDPYAAPALGQPASSTTTVAAYDETADAISRWLAAQRAQSAAMGLYDPTTGLPTPRGMAQAGQAYGNALIGSTAAPGVPGLTAGMRAGVGSDLASAAKADYLGRAPPGEYWVHGRANRDNLGTGDVILSTKNWDVADQYAGKKGSVWAIQPTGAANVMDFTDDATRDAVARALAGDHENGLLSGDLGGAIDSLPQHDVPQRISDQLDPPKIVDSAGWLDNRDFVSWLWDKYEPDVVKTSDGAAFLNANDPAAVSSARVR